MADWSICKYAPALNKGKNAFESVKFYTHMILMNHICNLPWLNFASLVEY